MAEEIMKFFKTVVIALISTFVFTGCYTQLQYTQRAKQVTERRSVEGYAWSSEEEAYAREGENYIPVHYRNHEIARYWDECRCSPYSYNAGYADGYDDGRFYSRPFYSSLGFGFGYNSWYGPRFGFTLSYNPYYYTSFYYPYSFYTGRPFYYDPFYHNIFWATFGPFYGGYYGYHNYGYGYGYGYYDNSPYYDNRNRRYGLRSRDGASRVDRNRSVRSRNTARIDTRTRLRNSGTSIDKRNTSSTRSRGTVDRSRSRSGSNGRVTPTRTRNSSGSGSVGRSRSSGSSRSSGTRSRGNDSISESRSSPAGFFDTRGNIVRSPSVRLASPEVEQDRLRNVRQRHVERSSSHSFWDRLKNTFDSDRLRRTFIRTRRGDSPSIRSHFNQPSSRPAIRSRSLGGNRSSGSTVTKSRSRSSSSGTRSRSSGRSRSRGNN